MDKSVSVVYYIDGKDWAEYIKDQLDLDEKVVTIIVDLQSNQFSQLSSSLVTIVILTPALMNVIRDDQHKTYAPVFRNCQRLLLLLMGETMDTLNEYKAKDRFVSPDDQKTKCEVLEYTNDWKSIEKFVCQWCDEEILRQEKDMVRTKKKPRQLTLVPSSGRCEVKINIFNYLTHSSNRFMSIKFQEKTEVAAIFPEEVEHEQLDVFLENESDHSEVIHITKVTKLNPYTFSFTLPGSNNQLSQISLITSIVIVCFSRPSEHHAGKMIVKAMVKRSDTDEAAPQMSCISWSTFTYFSDMEPVNGINQILLYVSVFVCTCLNGISRFC